MSDTSTRSGMLWEVERILSECKELGNMPEILLMENVPQVHCEESMPDFIKWQNRLEELGYKNYWQDLIATDYGIPQTRNRCFMVSILGEYNYNFPIATPLKLKLKDMLEDEVDENYYISDKLLKCFMRDDDSKFPRKQRFEQALKQTNEKNIAGTITTSAGNRATDNFIINKALKETLETNKIENGIHYIDGYNRKIRKDEICSTISTRINESNDSFILIKNATKKGYLEASEGDGVDISSRMQHHRGTVQKEMIQTLDCKGGESKGVVVQNLKRQLCNDLIENNKVKEFDVIKHSYSKSRIKDWESRSIEKNNESPTLDTRCDCLGIVVGTYQFAKSDKFMQGKDRFQENKEVSDTLQTSPKEGIVTNNLRIRKLTPKECFRLQGVRDEDFDKCAKNQSNASLYHLAGDSIVVNVLMAIFKEMI